jgi:hypothetical protein
VHVGENVYIRRTVVRKVKECRLLSVWCMVPCSYRKVHCAGRRQMRTASGCWLAEINVMLLVPGFICLFPKVCILRSDATLSKLVRRSVLFLAVLLYIMYLRACARARVCVAFTTCLRIFKK